jgi:hypothetical protein
MGGDIQIVFDDAIVTTLSHGVKAVRAVPTPIR